MKTLLSLLLSDCLRFQDCFRDRRLSFSEREQDHDDDRERDECVCFSCCCFFLWDQRQRSLTKNKVMMMVSEEDDGSKIMMTVMMMMMISRKEQYIVGRQRRRKRCSCLTLSTPSSKNLEDSNVCGSQVNASDRLEEDEGVCDDDLAFQSLSSCSSFLVYNILFSFCNKKNKKG